MAAAGDAGATFVPAANPRASVSLEALGGGSNGETDNTPAFIKWLDGATKGSWPPHLLLGCGVYRFYTPLPVITRPISVTGHGITLTVLRFDQTSGHCFHLEGSAGSRFESFSINIAGDSELTSYFYLRALPHQGSTQGGSPDGTNFRDLWLSRWSNAKDSRVQYGILLRGNERPQVGDVMCGGLRNIKIESVDIFLTSFCAVEACSVRGLKVRDVSCFSPTTPDGGKFIVTAPDNADETNRSWNVQLNGCSLQRLCCNNVHVVLGMNSYSSIDLGGGCASINLTGTHARSL